MKAICLILFCYIVSVANAFAQPAGSYEKGRWLDSLRKVYFKHSDRRIAIETKLKQQALKDKDQELTAFVEILAFTRQLKGNPAILDQFKEQIETKYKALPRRVTTIIKNKKSLSPLE